MDLVYHLFLLLNRLSDRVDMQPASQKSGLPNECYATGGLRRRCLQLGFCSTRGHAAGLSASEQLLPATDDAAAAVRLCRRSAVPYKMRSIKN